MSIKNSIVSALKNNLIPGLVLQVFAAVILALYFWLPGAKPYFDYFGALKQQYGYAYSFAATALFGGLVPFLYLWLSAGLAQVRRLWAVGLFYAVFWGVKGMEVDFFYRLQGLWFGMGNDLATLATKVAVDQFIYSAFWAAPTITLSYLWMQGDFNCAAWRRALDRQWIVQTLPTVILSNWLVWIPAVSIVYAMPNELQIPLFNLVLCFWVLMLAVLNKRAG
ncbi:MAG: hypothetical protein RL497_86 [Pseudomonadota bacterium]|jgi:hypothetical protein